MFLELGQEGQLTSRENDMVSMLRLGLDALSLVGPIGVQQLDFCCFSVSVLVLVFISVLNIDLYVRCFAEVEVLHADRITLIFVNHNRT